MDGQYKFQKLTPCDEVEMGIYEKAMEYVFANDDIRNIAISGTYGAGKSSMIETYKKVFPEKKFMHISLAHFDSEINEDITKDIKYNQVSTLEGKIINEIIHQIDPQKIPLTNFKIKKDVDNKGVFIVSLLISLFITITCFLRFKNTWERMVTGFSSDFLKKLFYFTTTKEMEFILGTVAMIILWTTIYQIIKLQKGAKLLKKINIKGNEIEVFEESKDSYFDKYLNEVLYIFEHTEVDGR